MRSEFTLTLRKAEYLKRNLKPSDSCPPAEKSIYESALQMVRPSIHRTPHRIVPSCRVRWCVCACVRWSGTDSATRFLFQGREGATFEVLRHFNKAESLYVRSSQLLQLLSGEAIHPSDKAVLESCTHQPTPPALLHLGPHTHTHTTRATSTDIASFERRLREVRKKQTVLDGQVNAPRAITRE